MSKDRAFPGIVSTSKTVEELFLSAATTLTGPGSKFVKCTVNTANDSWTLTLPALSEMNLGDMIFIRASVANSKVLTVQDHYDDAAFLDATLNEDGEFLALKACFDSWQPVGVNALNFGADTASSDTYTVQIPWITHYYTGLMIAFSAVTANTGACTVNVNGLGAKNLLMLNNQTPADNYIEASSIVLAIYDGTSFQLMSPDANP